MNTTKLSFIFQSLTLQQVPLIQAVPFLLRLQRIPITRIAKKAKVSRGFIYKVLGGTRKSKSVKHAITAALGFDPWDAAAEG